MGHGLRRIGASDPQNFYMTAAHGFKHLDRCLTRLIGHARYAPQSCHFGTMLRVFQIAMCRQQIRHAAYLAAAHGVRLPRQGKWTGPRLADLARCQMQIDDRGIFFRAVL